LDISTLYDNSFQDITAHLRFYNFSHLTLHQILTDKKKKKRDFMKTETETMKAADEKRKIKKKNSVTEFLSVTLHKII